MLGKHNVLNAAAAIVLCLQEGIAVEVIQDSLSNFMGIDRRMQILGERKLEIVLAFTSMIMDIIQLKLTKPFRQ